MDTTDGHHLDARSGQSGDIARSCPLQGMLRYSPIVHLSMPLRLGNFQPQRGSWSTTFAEPTRIVGRSFFQGADEDAETFGQQGGLIIDTRDLFRLRKTVAAGTIRGQFAPC